jgi:hypothetical protein
VTPATRQAIEATIRALEADQGDIIVALLALRKLAGLPTADETIAPQDATTAAKRETKRSPVALKARKAETKPAPAKAPGSTVETSLDGRILSALRLSPLSPGALRAAFRDVPARTLAQTLEGHREQGLIVRTGSTTNARWQMATKPAAPKSANTDQFETVWDGSKHAPSLIGDQPRKAS